MSINAWTPLIAWFGSTILSPSIDLCFASYVIAILTEHRSDGVCLPKLYIQRFCISSVCRLYELKKEVRLKCVFSLYSCCYSKAQSFERECKNSSKKTHLIIGNSRIGKSFEVALRIHVRLYSRSLDSWICRSVFSVCPNRHEKHLAFHRRYPETFASEEQGTSTSPYQSLPVYFGNVCLRFLPVIL